MTSLWMLMDRFDPAYPPTAALVFVILMLPIWLYMAWFDMARLRIVNGLVLLVLGIYVVVGPFVLPFDIYLAQYLQLGIVFLAILVLYAAGTMGGGDAKFIAVASPYFMREDWVFILLLFISCTFAAIVVHRVFLVFGADRATPLWLSWRSGQRFPLGLALGGVVTIYLATAAF